MFNPCFLIISYVSSTDDARAQKFTELVNTLDEWFDLPILVMARDWATHKMPESKNLHVYYIDQPGICTARKALRTVALLTEYNFFIMLDDDVTLNGSKEGAQLYLEQAKKYQHGFIVNPIIPMLKLFGVSREIFEAVEYAPFTNSYPPEPGRYLGFEDAAYVGECLTRFPDRAGFAVGVYDDTDLKGFSLNSTWLNADVKPYVPLQYINTRHYLYNVSPQGIYWFSSLRLTYKIKETYDDALIYPLLLSDESN